MKKLLVGILLMLMPTMAFADITRTMQKVLTISGAPINGLQIASNQTVTSDGIYQAGSQTFGYSALATQISQASGGISVKISYQTSYDNINWFTPNTTSAGTLTSQGVLATAITGNTWIVYQYTVYPYIRFV